MGTYSDQAPLFMTGQYREPHFTPEEIRKHLESTMKFRPRA